jgi:nucleoid-associated protein YgaU
LSPCAQAVVVGSVLTAVLLAVAAAPDAMGAEPGRERQQLAPQAEGPRPDATPKATDTEQPPLKWLRYSRERFRTLMRMLAARAARSDTKRAADEAKRAADAKAAEETKRAAEAKAAEEAQRAAEAEAAQEAKRVAEAKATQEAKRVAETRRVAEAEAAQEAKRVAEAKAADEAKRAADAKAAAPAAEPGKRPARADCGNAGVKVAGAGWYVVQHGDSLWSIARFSTSGRTYWRVLAANRRTIANPARIWPCQHSISARACRRPRCKPACAGAAVRRRAIDTALPGFVD